MNVVILKPNKKEIYFGLPIQYALDELNRSQYPAFICQNKFMHNPPEDKFYLSNEKFKKKYG